MVIDPCKSIEETLFVVNWQAIEEEITKEMERVMLCQHPKFNNFWTTSIKIHQL
jgi:hypothetical protein